MTKAEVQLSRFIEDRLTPGTDVADVDRRIRAHFEEEWAIVYTDMTGLSRHRPAETVISYLCMVHEMKRITRPLLESSQGKVIKTITDSHLVIFKRAHDALAGLLQMNRRLAAYNAERPEDQRIEIGAGLGFGKILKVGEEEVFGLEVNAAVHLGETAEAYEILVTDAARAAMLHTPGVVFEQSVGGNPHFPSFKTKYDLQTAPRPVETDI